MNYKKIKLMTEYGGTVLWGVDPSDMGPVDPADLPLSDELRHAIASWAETYDKTLDLDNLEESGFACPSDLLAFQEEGLRLWAALRTELGSEWTVTFFDSDHGFRYS